MRPGSFFLSTVIGCSSVSSSDWVTSPDGTSPSSNEPAASLPSEKDGPGVNSEAKPTMRDGGKGDGAPMDSGVADVRDSSVVTAPNRSAAEVCARYRADFPERATTVFTAGTGSCALGSVSAEAIDDALRRLNFFRWLVGVAPVTVDAAHSTLAQYSAVITDANQARILQQRQSPHHPAPSWTCYTPQGAQGSEESNIALGSPSPADSVEGYVTDDGVPSLGHRRWSLYPALDRVGFGHVRRVNAMLVTGTQQVVPPAFVAYPSPGPFPRERMPAEWSIFFPSASGAISVAVTSPSGASIAVDVSPLTEPMAWPGIKIKPRASVAANTEYTVRATVGTQIFSYSFTPVDCP